MAPTPCSEQQPPSSHLSCLTDFCRPARAGHLTLHYTRPAASEVTLSSKHCSLGSRIERTKSSQHLLCFLSRPRWFPLVVPSFLLPAASHLSSLVQPVVFCTHGVVHPTLQIHWPYSTCSVPAFHRLDTAPLSARVRAVQLSNCPTDHIRADSSSSSCGWQVQRLF